MLRSRLYIGMLPVVGLLIAVCLYSVYSYKHLNSKLDELQSVHYATISKVDQILLATSQVERAVRLRKGEDDELASRIHERSQRVFDSWLEFSPIESESENRTPEAELSMLIRNLRNLSNSIFNSNEKRPATALDLLLERIEDTAIRSITARNEKIIEINQSFQKQSRTHFQVVLGGILSSVALTGFVAYVLSQRILKPVDALTEFASNLADSNWETRFTPSSKDEIAKLEIAVAEMADRIRAYKKATNKKIMATRLRMEECFSNLPHPVLFINSKRKIVYQNPTAKSLVEILQWNKQWPESLNSRIETVFGTGEEILPTEFEETVSFKANNEELHFLPTLVRIDSENSNDIECALILQDVTNLRLADELKSDLVATISHEIKTPVTSANLALLLVLEKSLGELNEDQEEMVQTAADDLKRLQRLLDHMLQIARLEKRIPKLDTQNFKPSQLIESVVAMHAHNAENKSISLKTEVEENLEDVSVDSKMIEVALSNYIANAIKYGGSESSILVYVRSEKDECIRFGVRDNGPGIPDEDTEKVFDKFYRISETRSADGIGIGLSICKDIVVSHGGTVGCENVKPNGADFYFSLPSASNSSKTE